MVPVAVPWLADRRMRLASAEPLNWGLLRLAVKVSLSSTMLSLLTVTVAVPVVLPARIVTRKLLRARSSERPVGQAAGGASTVLSWLAELSLDTVTVSAPGA